MKHEPECPRSCLNAVNGKPLYEDDIPEGYECMYCLIATRAYQRGREDAAAAVEAIHCPNPHAYIYPTEESEATQAVVCESCWDGEYRFDVYPCETLLAARGDGEQT